MAIPEAPAQALVVFVTCPPERADALAGDIVEAGVAACVNVVPKIGSTYRWKGAVQRDEEALLIIKTAAARFDALKDFVLAKHPYELPEILAVQPAFAHKPYLEWVVENSL